ncbi:MAG: AI-2E family transporter [Chroococcidiopsidaceae cyanobacterium CP_BM_RX_35]|nr:AI-2E family transporter [Chroococcidiopsidaceae cyanobacterium CP_BM_RX_35]
MSSFRYRDRIENQITRGAPLALVMAAIAFVLYKLVIVLEILAVAVLLALVLRTLLRWLQRIFKLRWLSILVLILLIIGFGAFIALVLIPGFISETQTLIAKLPDYANSLQNLAARLHNRWSFIPSISSINLNRLRGYLEGILTSVPLLARNSFSGAIETIGTIILALYMAYDPNSVIRGILRLIPRRHHEKFKEFLHSCEVRLRGWIFGTGVAMFFIGVGAGVGLWFIGVPLPISFGVFAGFFEIIPYFGSIAGAVLPALIALTTPNGLMKAVYVLALFLVLNQIDAHLIQPLIMGRQVHVSPVMVIVSFLVMGELFGFVGVLVAVPAAAVVVTLVDEYTPKERQQDAPKAKTENYNP